MTGIQVKWGDWPTVQEVLVLCLDCFELLDGEEPVFWHIADGHQLAVSRYTGGRAKNLEESAEGALQ